VSRLALDIISDVAFGCSTGSLLSDDNELATAYHRVLALQSGMNVTKFIALLSIPGMPRFIRSETCYRLVNNKWLKRLVPAICKSFWQVVPSGTLLIH
jgi:hypothetical protein